MLEQNTKISPIALSQKIKVEESVGLVLAHDITEIRPGKYKGPFFRKGHKIEEKDLCHLMRLGKRHLYILDLAKDQLHEDDAVLELARALAGHGIYFDPQPREGKIQLLAAHDGLFKVKVESLIRFNLIPEVMCASLHNNTPVNKGQNLAGTRAIPLVVAREIIDNAVDLCRKDSPVFSVKMFKPIKASLIITGSEVYDGLIEDKFESVVNKKLESYGASLIKTAIVPDDENRIAEKIDLSLKEGADLIITTGGMSVDPDDVTRLAIRKAGVDQFYYGAAVLPGAMFLLAYRKDVPIVGIPACGIYHPTTIFDLILPRLLAGEKPGDLDLARYAHGGLCSDCPTCNFPSCAFGKSAAP